MGLNQNLKSIFCYCKKNWILFFPVAVFAAFSACAPIKITTPEPVKIDINMEVEIVHKNAPTNQAPTASEPTKGRFNRAAEIQNLKNNRIVGENNKSYLTVLTIPPSWKGQESYINSIVEAENNERQTLNATAARENKKTLTGIETEAATRFREAAYVGEWIQATNGTWIQKK